MRLYTYYRSSASYRVRIALGLKGIECEHVFVHLVRDGGEQHQAVYTAINAMAQVPVLEWEEEGRVVRLSQSLAIIDYLDVIAPSPPLLPSTTLERVRVRELAEIVNAGIQPLHNLSLLNRIEALGGDRISFARVGILRGLDAMEAIARTTARRFLVGDAITLADVCLVPQLYQARRFDVPLASYPTLVDVEARCVALPAFERAHPDRQPDSERARGTP